MPGPERTTRCIIYYIFSAVIIRSFPAVILPVPAFNCLIHSGFLCPALFWSLPRDGAPLLPLVPVRGLEGALLAGWIFGRGEGVLWGGYGSALRPGVVKKIAVRAGLSTLLTVSAASGVRGGIDWFRWLLGGCAPGVLTLTVEREVISVAAGNQAALK